MSAIKKLFDYKELLTGVYLAYYTKRALIPVYLLVQNGMIFKLSSKTVDGVHVGFVDRQWDMDPEFYTLALNDKGEYIRSDIAYRLLLAPQDTISNIPLRTIEEIHFMVTIYSTFSRTSKVLDLTEMKMLELL